MIRFVSIQMIPILRTQPMRVNSLIGFHKAHHWWISRPNRLLFTCAFGPLLSHFNFFV